jgi:hypothetical protein
VAWFRVQLRLRADASSGTIAIRETEYAVAAMDAMEAEDKAECIALEEANADGSAQWRWHSTPKTVKFSNSAQPLNDVEDGERLEIQSLEFTDEETLGRYLTSL